MGLGEKDNDIYAYAVQIRDRYRGIRRLGPRHLQAPGS